MGIFSWTLSRRATKVGAGGVLYLEEAKSNCFKEALGESTTKKKKLGDFKISID
jgi:hypothetical protein